MATNPVQNESAQAKPLTFHQVGMEIEDAQASADELAQLIWLASGNADMVDEPVRKAMRAMMDLAEAQAAKLLTLSERVYAASAAQRGGNVADFPSRG